MFSRLFPINFLRKALCLLLSFLIALQPLSLQAAANHLYGDVQQVITGKQAHTALVDALTAGGMSEKEANTYQKYVEVGVIGVSAFVTGGVTAYKFTLRNASKLSATERATLTSLEKRSAHTATGNKPNITIRDHYAHHKEIVDDLKDQLRLQGYRVSEKEISFGSSCGSGRCRPDIVYQTPDGKVFAIEVKTGKAGLSARQHEIFPQIESGEAIPRGKNADRFGFDINIPLKKGIPIDRRPFPGVGE